MSDNLSTMKQAAVAGADDSAVDTAEQITDRNCTIFNNKDQLEDGNDAGSLTADDSESGKLVNGAKANASTVSILLFYHKLLPQTFHHPYPSSILLPVPYNALCSYSKVSLTSHSPFYFYPTYPSERRWP